MAQKKKKKLSKFGKIVMDIILVISLAVALFSGYKLITGLLSYREAKNSYDDVRNEYMEKREEGEKTERVFDWESLMKVNPDIVGWMVLEDSSIDYPVVHGADNVYYLDHLFDLTYNPSGALFIDCDNDGDFSDKNTVIYGHHMLQEPLMFADVEKYKNQDYYESHKVMQIYTPTTTYDIYPIAGKYETGTGGYIQFYFNSDEEFLSYIQEFINASTFTSEEEIKPEDKIVLLSTCEYNVHTVDGRYALIGKIVERKGE